MRIRLLLALMALTGMAGCQTEPQSIYAKPYTLKPDEMQRIENAVTARLHKPDTANFGSMLAKAAPSADVAVCGYVDSIGPSGRYTGPQPFYGVLASGAFSPKIVGDGSKRSTDARAECAKAGMFR